MEKPKKLYHISRVGGLKVLEPREPSILAKGEPKEKAISFCRNWWECLMLANRKPFLPLHLYVVDDPEELKKIKKIEDERWFYGWKEWRAYEPVKVKYLGKLKLNNKIVQSIFDSAGFCEKCGAPNKLCDDPDWCPGTIPPELEEENLPNLLETIQIPSLTTLKFLIENIEHFL